MLDRREYELVPVAPGQRRVEPVRILASDHVMNTDYLQQAPEFWHTKIGHLTSNYTGAQNTIVSTPCGKQLATTPEHCDY